MDFPNYMTVSEITHVSVVNFKKGNTAAMKNRPWLGLAFSLGGEISYFHGSEKITLSGDRIVFLPQHSSYDILCHKSGAFALVNFLTANECKQTDFIVEESKNTELCKSEFYLMQKSFAEESVQRKYEALSFLYKILAIFFDSTLPKSLPNAVKLAIKYIDSNLSDQSLCNTAVSDHLGISEVYLRKLFSNNMSVSVNRYIRDKQIGYAKTLLENTNFSVTEIAEKCGYSCIYYFCRSFKGKTGCSPSQYRSLNHRELF